MLNTSQIQLGAISVHQVGNQSYEDHTLKLSEKPLEIETPELQTLLTGYFLKHFEIPEYFAFNFLNGDLQYHAVYNLIKQMFETPAQFHDISIQLAQHLFECTVHPNIKSGDFYVVYFRDAIFEDELVDAVGLFKIENKKGFLQLAGDVNSFSLAYHEGIDLEKIDKGCLILNTAAEEGYRMQIVDKSNRSFEAVYWREQFLHIQPSASTYSQTKNFLTATKSYVSQQMKADFDVERADQIDVLNKSIEYFKEHETFDEQTFSEQVFADPSIINSFQRYKSEYEEANGIELIPEFEISETAVKKQARVFKSVIKLDKNFHIYVHGDRSKISRETDESGRRFYKLYFEEER